MRSSAWSASRETRRELRTYFGVIVGFLAAGIASAVLYLAWMMAGPRITDAWLSIPAEMRLLTQVSILLGCIALATLASYRAWGEWRGRSRARGRARETPPILEFSAGSVTAAALAKGELMDARNRRELDENRRRYLVRPKDAMSRARRDWGVPVLFAEPTRAGDTRIEPVLALAATERRKHAKNLQVLTTGVGQFSSVRVIIGIGKGYTSLTRAHALRDDLGRIPGKIRMNVLVADPPTTIEPESPYGVAEPAPDDGEPEVIL